MRGQRVGFQGQHAQWSEIEAEVGHNFVVTNILLSSAQPKSPRDGSEPRSGARLRRHGTGVLHVRTPPMCSADLRVPSALPACPACSGQLAKTRLAMVTNHAINSPPVRSASRASQFHYRSSTLCIHLRVPVVAPPSGLAA